MIWLWPHARVQSRTVMLRHAILVVLSRCQRCHMLVRETISVSAPQKDIDAKNSTKSFLTFYVDDLSKMKWTVKNVLVSTLSVSFACSFQKYVMFSCCPWLLYSPDMLFLFLFCPEILRCSFYWSYNTFFLSLIFQNHRAPIASGLNNLHASSPCFSFITHSLHL